MTWYDQRKCQDFLEETDKLFEMLKLLILILLTNGLRVKKFVELLYRITKQLKKEVFEYPFNERKNYVFCLKIYY